MKKIASLGVALIAAAYAATAVQAAGSMDKGFVAVSATIDGVNTVSVQTFKISGDTLVTPNKINFGAQSNTVTAWSTLPTEYAKIIVADNSPTTWKLKVYTNNFVTAPDTTTWGLQYGGLISTNTTGGKVSLGWIASSNTVVGGPATGDPANGRVVDVSSNVIPALSNGFTYMKDKSDQDLPGLDGDQSFQLGDGYIDVARGSTLATRIVRPNVQSGEVQLATATSPFFVYVEGQFQAAKPAFYAGTITFDLINE